MGKLNKKKYKAMEKNNNNNSSNKIIITMNLRCIMWQLGKGTFLKHGILNVRSVYFNNTNQKFMWNFFNSCLKPYE